MNLLVFDGGNQNTLAIVRHLGKQHKEIKIHCIVHNKISLAGYSKYIYKKHLLPSLKTKPTEFLNSLLELIKTEKIDSLFPVGSASFSFCITHANLLSSVKTILPPKKSFDIAESKSLTHELAIAANVPVPISIKVKSREELNTIDLPYPIVIKAPFEMGKNVVEYAKNKEELFSKFDNMCKTYNFNYPDFPILQEYVNGDGYGFFAYYKNGVNQCYFMHRRLREFPVTGGASTCAESVDIPELKQLSENLMASLNWNGVAMVEFKKDNKTNTYKLMEINPKFWGSLELAIVSGINFPEFVINELQNKEQTFPTSYKKTTFQWLINGEFLHVCFRPKNFFAVLSKLFVSKKDIWLRDPLPNLLQFLLIPLRLKKK